MAVTEGGEPEFKGSHNAGKPHNPFDHINRNRPKKVATLPPTAGKKKHRLDELFDTLRKKKGG